MNGTSSYITFLCIYKAKYPYVVFVYIKKYYTIKTKYVNFSCLHNYCIKREKFVLISTNMRKSLPHYKKHEMFKIYLVICHIKGYK